MTDLKHPHKVGVIMGGREVVGQVVIRIKRIGMHRPESSAFGSGGHSEQTGVVFTRLISQQFPAHRARVTSFAST